MAGRKESKECRQTVFFTPLDPFGRDTQEEEEPSKDYSQPRKVRCHSSITCTGPTKARSDYQAATKAIVDHPQVPVHLHPGITVGGQEMPNGPGMTMTGKNTSGDRRKCDDNNLSNEAETEKIKDWWEE